MRPSHREFHSYEERWSEVFGIMVWVESDLVQIYVVGVVSDLEEGCNLHLVSISSKISERRARIQFMTSAEFLRHASNCFSQALSVAWTRWSAKVTLLSDGSSRASADPYSSTIRCILTHATNRLSVGAAASEFSRHSTHSAIQLEKRSILGRRRLAVTLRIFTH